MIALRLSIRTTCLSVGTVSCCHENFFPFSKQRDETGTRDDRCGYVLWPESINLQEARTGEAGQGRLNFSPGLQQKA